MLARSGDGFEGSLVTAMIGRVKIGLPILVVLGGLMLSTRPSTGQVSAPAEQTSPGRTRLAGDSPAEQTGTAIIRGRVVMDASGTATPIRNARVTVGSGPSTRDPFFTDAAGHFEFAGLAAGRYTLAAEKTGFAKTRYGSTHDLDPSLPVDVADAAIIEGIEITLSKGAAIVGQVVDELGDPVVGVPVSIGFRQSVGSETRFVAVARPPAETDDRGEYRIGGLAAGQYYLSVAGSSQGASIAGAPPEWARTTTWGRTFYQGASSLAGANPVQLAAGEELTGIDLTVEPFRPATLSLALTDVSGAPAAGLINLMMQDESLGTIERNIGAPFAGKDGERRTLTLDPGDWVAVALQNGPAALTHFRLSSGDETTLTLTPRSGAHVAGRVVVEGSTALPRLTSLLISVRGVGADAAAPLARGPAAVSPDGTFELINVFGTFELRPVTLPGGWVLRAERYGDRDLLDEPLTVNGGEDIRDVQMILTARLAELAGVAVDAEGRPSPRCAVAVVPDRADLRVASRRTRLERADQHGRFVVSDLLAGSYLAAAIPDIDVTTWLTPDNLDRLRRTATRVSLTDGEKGAITLPCLSIP